MKISLSYFWGGVAEDLTRFSCHNHQQEVFPGAREKIDAEPHKLQEIAADTFDMAAGRTLVDLHLKHLVCSLQVRRSEYLS